MSIASIVFCSQKPRAVIICTILASRPFVDRFSTNGALLVSRPVLASSVFG
ncbi:MAG: hypothetical protein U0L66_03845 [Acutalibacteraceae bacterium]|nr:hypothetical protein [Acutalibacteraceae bacterium]